MQIIIDEDNFAKMDLPKQTRSVVSALCLGLIQDSKIQLVSFIRLNRFIEIDRQ